MTAAVKVAMIVHTLRPLAPGEIGVFTVYLLCRAPLMALLGTLR